MTRLIPIFLLCVLFFLAPSSHAEPPISKPDLKKVKTILNHYNTMGISRFNNDRLLSVTLATRIRAKKETVFNLFKDPENFYYISSLFKENKILDTHENAITWSWASRHRFLSVTGKNSMFLYPPSRIDVNIDKSSLGNGAFVVRLYEDGPKRTIMTITGLLRVESSQWLIKYLVGGNPSMKQAMNIAIGLVILKGTKQLAQRLDRGRKLRHHRVGNIQSNVPEPVDADSLAAIRGLLPRGQIFLCNPSKSGRLQQATVVDVIDAPPDAIEQAVMVPRNYQKHISSISDVNVLRQAENATVFSWKLGFSIFGIASINRLKKTGAGVLLSAESGDLEGAHWLWQIAPLCSKKSIVAYHAFADVKKLGVIMETTVNREPYLEHGLVMGSNIVMLKAIKKLLSSPIAEHSK